MHACFKSLGNKTLLLLISGFQRRFYPVHGHQSRANTEMFTWQKVASIECIRMLQSSHLQLALTIVKFTLAIC